MKSVWSVYDRTILKKILQQKGSCEIAKEVLSENNLKVDRENTKALSRYIKRNSVKLQLNSGVLNACDNLGVDPSTTPMIWLKSSKESIRVTNPLFVPPKEKEVYELHRLIIQDVKKYAPKYNTYKREKLSDSHLLVIDPADVHIGKLCSSFEVGCDYNSQIAVKRVLDGVDGILNKLGGVSVDKIQLVIGNDILHIDNPKRTTTSGTPQDTDGMWHTNYLIAKQLYVDVIEKLMSVADVHVTYNPSNHDYTNGFFLAQLIQTHFRLCENVKFDCDISHRKYFTYFNNLIGSTHGDGAKNENLPLLMAHESEFWGKCQHRYFYVHHLHHKWSKDIMSVTVEGLRSPSEADSWHHRNGYQHAPKAIEGFVHHKQHGQIMRITHLF